MSRVSALEEALARFGKPEIFNTGQGAQFTSAAFTGTLATAGIRISMDGRGRWMDNVFIERLWRSLKYEDIYLKGHADGCEARAGIALWMAFYNLRRPHQALANRTPVAIWREGITGELGEKAGDMTLRLDNADALSTSLRWPYLHNRLGSDCSAIKLRLTEPLASSAHSSSSKK